MVSGPASRRGERLIADLLVAHPRRPEVIRAFQEELGGAAYLSSRQEAAAALAQAATARHCGDKPS